VKWCADGHLNTSSLVLEISIWSFFHLYLHLSFSLFLSLFLSLSFRSIIFYLFPVILVLAKHGRLSSTPVGFWWRYIKYSHSFIDSFIHSIRNSLVSPFFPLPNNFPDAVFSAVTQMLPFFPIAQDSRCPIFRCPFTFYPRDIHIPSWYIWLPDTFYSVCKAINVVLFVNAMQIWLGWIEALLSGFAVKYGTTEEHHVSVIYSR